MNSFFCLLVQFCALAPPTGISSESSKAGAGMFFSSLFPRLPRGGTGLPSNRNIASLPASTNFFNLLVIWSVEGQVGSAVLRENFKVVSRRISSWRAYPFRCVPIKSIRSSAADHHSAGGWGCKPDKSIPASKSRPYISCSRIA